MWPVGTKQFIGLDIAATTIKAVRIARVKRTWRLLENHVLPLPEGVLKPSFKNDNIVDTGRFTETLQLLVSHLEVKTATVGLSLPSEIVKTLIQGYQKLPDSRAEVEKFIGWSMERSFHFPVQSAQIGYQAIGQDADGVNQLLVTVAMRNVVAQYEALLQRLGLDPRAARRHQSFQLLLPPPAALRHPRISGTVRELLQFSGVSGRAAHLFPWGQTRFCRSPVLSGRGHDLAALRRNQSRRKDPSIERGQPGGVS
jgi:hypothetical protein